MDNLSSEIDVRLQKVKSLKEQGVIVYKDKFDRTNRLEEAKKLEDGTMVKVCGRMVFRRIMGKLSFFALMDIDARLQASISINEVSEEDYAFFKSMVDIGDFVGVEGELYTTHTGEKTVRAHKLVLLSKAILPLPEKFHGLTNQDQRYRERCMDLVSNEQSRQVFLKRSKFLSFIRSFLEKNGFLEVETPILQSAVCGASAKPFFTTHNALDKICNLRIAPEVYLKQLIAGGFDRVFEVAKCFRNEGIDTRHNPEFTMIELYQAYADYNDMMTLTENMVAYVAQEVLGTMKIKYGEHEIDLTPPWDRKTMLGSIKEATGVDFMEIYDAKQAVEAAKKLNVQVDDDMNWGQVVEAVFEDKIEPSLIQPCHIIDYPREISPLAKVHRDNSRLTERFETRINGWELANAFSELTDPIDQRSRFEAQALAKANGDEEAMELDEDFITSLEYGMPPTGGMGMGIDRLVMLLTDSQTIRDVIAFPTMRPLDNK